MARARVPRPRPEVASAPAFVPGRTPLPRAGLTTYKLSANESPFEPLPGVLDAARAALAETNRYPDPGATELREVLGDRLGVGVDHLLAGAGGVALLQHLLTAYCGPDDEVVLPWRSFEAFPVVVVAAGAQGVPVLLTRDGRHDLDAMAAAVTERTRAVLLCTPNSPTGPALTQTEVDAFLAKVPREVLVVFDEAYVELVRSDDPFDGVATALAHRNVVAVRTFSKVHGLAGLRIGYAVGQPHLLDPVATLMLPFTVSRVAASAALASVLEERALHERVEAVVAERERVVTEARAAGWKVPDAQGSFFWLPLARAVEMAEAATERGIVVRPFTGDGVRVTVGEPEANDRVVDLVRSFPLPGF